MADDLFPSGGWAGGLADALRDTARSYADAAQEAFAPWAQAMALGALPAIREVWRQRLACQSSNVVLNAPHAPCANRAGIVCAACRRPVCLHHAFLSAKGHAICWQCVQAQQAACYGQAPPPPRPAAAPRPPVDVEKRGRALRLLGLGEGATWDEVRAAHRTLAGRAHPDRHENEPEAERAQWARRATAINAAFAFLKAQQEGQSVAA